LVSGYSTTVDGKQYSGSVEKSGNTYTASIPGVAGATATGSTEDAAENNLSNRISVLV
jgi:predicted RNase H-like HicB family nuclease